MLRAEGQCRVWWRAAVGGVLAAAVLLTGNLRAADDPAKTDEPRKEKAKAAEPPPRDTVRADQDVQKQLDELRREMAEMRKTMDQLSRRFGGAMPGAPGAPGFPQGGFGAGGFGGGRGFGAGFGQHPRLGVRVDLPSETLTEQLNLKKGQGLVVEDVMPDSPASKAGLKQYDVLVDLNGKPVPSDVREFTLMLSDIKPDTAVDARVIRKGKEETVKGIKLQAGQPEGFPGAPRPRPPARPGTDRDRDRR